VRRLRHALRLFLGGAIAPQRRVGSCRSAKRQAARVATILQDYSLEYGEGRLSNSRGTPIKPGEKFWSSMICSPLAGHAAEAVNHS